MINWVVYKQQSQFVADKKAFPCQDNDATKVDKEGKACHSIIQMLFALFCYLQYSCLLLSHHLWRLEQEKIDV